MTVAGRRKFLKSIQEKAGALTLPPYTFYYHGAPYNYIELPVHSSELKDEWEFYKEPAKSYEETLQTGTLRKVVYPYGGYTAFFFEPHSYWDASTSSSVQGGGIRIRKTIAHDGLSTAGDMIKEYEYTQSNGQTSGKLIYKPFFTITTVRLDKIWDLSVTGGPRYRQVQFGGFMPPYSQYFTLKASEDLSSLDTYNGSAVGYERVVEKRKDAGRTVYEFDMPAAFDVSANNNEWVASTVAIARTSTGTSACFENIGIPEDMNAYPYAVNSNYNFARGLLKKSTEYKEDDTKVREVVYEYQRIFGATAIRPIYGLVLDELPTYYYTGSAYVDSKMFLYSKYPVFTDVATVIKKQTETLFHSADLLKKTESITDFFYEGAYHRNLTRVTRTNSDGVQSVVRYKYLQDFTLATPTDAAALALAKLALAHRTNALVETMTSKIAAGVEKFTDASVTVFQDVGGKIFPYKQFSFQSADGITSFTPSSIQTTPGSSIFQYDQTNYVLKNTILTVDAFGNPVETIGRDKRSAAVVQGYGGTLPVLALSNARLQEVAYSDFETTTSVDFASWSGPTFSVGRTGAKAINIGVGGTLSLLEQLQKIRASIIFFRAGSKQERQVASPSRQRMGVLI